MEGSADIEIDKITGELIKRALTEIELKYGTGNNDGRNPKRYHNRRHAEDVIESARQIALEALKSKKIGERDVYLCQIAAAFHDIELDAAKGTNEIESAKIARQLMDESKLFSGDEILKVEKMIISTSTKFVDGIMVRLADKKDYLSLMLADADLSHLGKEPNIYWENATRVLREVKNSDDAVIESYPDFVSEQLSVIKNHKFFTPEAQKLFPNVAANREFTVKKLQVVK